MVSAADLSNYIVLEAYRRGKHITQLTSHLGRFYLTHQQGCNSGQVEP